MNACDEPDIAKMPDSDDSDDEMTPEMARRMMGYLTINAMNADLLRYGSPVRSRLRKSPCRMVRRWYRPDVVQHRAPCPHSSPDAPCPICTADDPTPDDLGALPGSR